MADVNFHNILIKYDFIDGSVDEFNYDGSTFKFILGNQFNTYIINQHK